MRDESARLEWYNCRECDGYYTWFRVDVMDGLVMYGWLHKDEHRECSRNTGLHFQDFRHNIEGYDHEGQRSGQEETEGEDECQAGPGTG